MAQLYMANIPPAQGRGKHAVLINTNDDQMSTRVPDHCRDLQKIVERWEGVAVVVHHHRPTDSWIFIAIHDVTLGPASGGTRVRRYATLADGLCDALRLAQAMTSKWAFIESEWGGGKAVLALGRELNPAERHELLGTYAEILNLLNGAFWTAGDMGTSGEDLSYLTKFSEYVTAGEHSHGESVDSGTFTALGLRAGIRACLAHRFGNSAIAGRSVLVQGLGQVGGMLARLLVLDGARVLANDLDRQRAIEFQKELDCTVVDSDGVYDTPCDVYAPCGTGATLNNNTVERLSCEIVSGGANNQLASPEIADALHERRILYAPDYAVNAGGAIGLTMFGRGAPFNEICARIEGIETTLAQILNRASERATSPARVADEHIKTVLSRACSREQQYKLTFPAAASARSR